MESLSRGREEGSEDRGWGAATIESKRREEPTVEEGKEPVRQEEYQEGMVFQMP